MSVRAHRILDIVMEGESFNLWQDNPLIDSLSKGGYLSTLDIDGYGVIDVPVSELEEIISGLNEDDYSFVQNIKNDLEWAKETERFTIQYYCF